MKLKHNDKGFTLAELLVVVAILTILGGLVFLAVQNNLRSMTRLEYDNAAKELFVVAQNHLTLAHSQGYYDLTDADAGAKEAPGDEQDHIYYILKNGNEAGPNMLRLMLPDFSAEANLLTGNYIIRYDFERGLVLDVFYSGKVENSGFQLRNRFNHEFSEDEYFDLLNNYRDSEGASKRRERQNYNGQVIGWYGADAPEKPEVLDLKAPRVTVTNADRLTVAIEHENSVNASDGLLVQLHVRGKISGYTKVCSLFQDGQLNEAAKDIGTVGSEKYEIVLDDVTNNGKHFAQLFNTELGTGSPFRGDNSEKLIPGEDIEVWAVCSSTQRIAPICSSGIQTTNSIFADGSRTGKSDAVKTANIASIRHLENLSPAISGIGDSSLEPVNAIRIEAAIQTRDLYWTKADGEKGFVENTDGTVRTLNDSTGNEKTYYPVVPGRSISYDGQNHSISGVKIDANMDAGLFGSLPSASSVKNLELIDFHVTTGHGTAGTLAGSITGTEVTNVFAHNTRGGASEDTLQVTGSGDTGGLIGSMSGGSVSKCAAAVYVNSTGASAGGLIGRASGGSISDSYSGGHTTGNGKYWDNSFAVLSSGAGRVNVRAAREDAGGLIGTSSAAIRNCYSTSSVRGATSAGGFAGNASGTITNCYCTGLVLSADYNGTPADARELVENSYYNAFIGRGSAAVTDSYYYSGSNNSYYAGLGFHTADGESLLELTDNKASAMDSDWESYKAFFGSMTELDGAQPYDNTLVNHYQSRYPFKTIRQLNDTASSGRQESVHFGDWPEAENMIINK